MRTRQSRPLPAFLALAAWRGAAAQYRTPDDVQASKEAQQVQKDKCANVDLTDIDRVAGAESLKSWLGDEENVMLTILRKAASTDDLKNQVEDTITASWLVKTAGPLIFSFVLAIVWCFCCWTACPFCKFCLCCRRTRRAPKWAKFALLVLMALLLLGMTVAAMVALRGRAKISAGLESMPCTSAKTLSHTLDGATGFIGILPMMTQLSAVKNSLADGSAFVTEVQRISTDTAQLERAQYVATQSLLLLQSSLRSNNRAPAQAAIGPFIAAVAQVSDAVQAGMGQAMTAARTEVNNQLSGANRRTLRNSVDNAVTPLRSAADVVRNSLWYFIKPEWLDLLDATIAVASSGTISIACLVFLVVTCGLTSGMFYAFMDYSSAKAEKGDNPWNANTYRCALATWCCGYGYMFLVFFVSGLMVLGFVPMASGCLVLDDISGQTVRDILPALGSNVQGDSFDMLANLADACFSKSAAPGASILDAVYLRENGVKMTLKTKLQTQLVGQISARFAAVNQKLSQTTPLATHPDVNDLKSSLSSFTISAGSGYSCPEFQSSGGSAGCDVLGMTRSGNRFTNDCVIGTSPLRMTQRAKSCSAAQLQTYMRNWATRLDKVLQNVDLAVASDGNKISQNLQTSVNRYVTTPINAITNTAKCDVLSADYQDFVAGFCFEGVRGLGFVASAYVANGILTLFTVLVAYGLWRVSLDNRWEWSNEVQPIDSVQRF